MTLLGAVLILFLGFLFSVVSSRITGEVGSSSCPLSGMTIGVLMATCGIFLLTGREDPVRAARAHRRRGRVHRDQQRRHVLAGPEDGLPAGRDAREAAGRAARRRDHVRAGGRLDHVAPEPRRDDRGPAAAADRPGAGVRSRGRSDVTESGATASPSAFGHVRAPRTGSRSRARQRTSPIRRRGKSRGCARTASAQGGCRRRRPS